MAKAVTQMATLKEMAVQHLKAGRYQKALVYFKDILEKFQTYLPQIEEEAEMQEVIRTYKIPTHKNLSLCYLKLNKFQECSAQCQKVLQIEPNNIKILYRMGRVLIQRKELQDAQKYLKKAFHIDPHQKEVMKALQQIEAIRNKQKPVSTDSLKVRIQKLIEYLFTIVFFVPLFIINKGKSVVGSITKQE